MTMLLSILHNKPRKFFARLSGFTSAKNHWFTIVNVDAKSKFFLIKHNNIIKKQVGLKFKIPRATASYTGHNFINLQAWMPTRSSYFTMIFRPLMT